MNDRNCGNCANNDCPPLCQAPGYPHWAQREAGQDVVNHPEHYRPGQYEAIKVIEAWGLGFHLGNAVKYIARCGRKGDAVEDIRKAVWYLKRWLEVNGDNEADDA